MKSFFCLLLLFLLAACARPEKPILTDLPEVETLLQQLIATTGQVSSLDAVASVKLTVNGERFSSQQFLLLEKPDRLRTDVLAGFGKLMLQLTSDGTELSVFVNTSSPGRFYRGPATTENLSRFTRIPLATRDMLRLLLYDPPIVDYQQSKVFLDGGDLLLRLRNPELQQELLFNLQRQLIGCRYFSEDKLLLEVLYQKLDQEKLFPQTVKVEFAAEKTSAVIDFSEFQTNVTIPPERFRLKQPANVTVEALP